MIEMSFKIWLLKALSADKSEAARQLIRIVQDMDEGVTPDELINKLAEQNVSQQISDLAQQKKKQWEKRNENECYLDTIVLDVKRVLTYTATEGIAVDTDKLITLLTSIKEIEVGNRSPDTQAAFLAASQIFHSSVAPINAGKIRRWENSWRPLNRFKNKFLASKPLQATGSGTIWYALGLLLIICLAVPLHIYLLLVQHNTSTLEADLQQLQELRQLELSNAQAVNPILIAGTDESAHRGTETNADELESTLRDVYSKETYCHLNCEWQFHLSNTDNIISNPFNVLKTPSNSETNPPGVQACTKECQSETTDPGAWHAVALLDPTSTLNRSQSILKSLVTLILPFLYACMGALIYILRTISGELVAMRYSRARMTQYKLRLPMGIVAGVSIGFLFQPETFSAFSSLTPLGIAFIAGYSVELLFNLVDRVIGAFVDESKDNANSALENGAPQPSESASTRVDQKPT